MNGIENEETLQGRLLEIFLDAGAEWVLWLLLALSVLAVAVILERVVFYYAIARSSSATLQNAVDHVLPKRGARAALAELAGMRSLAAAVTRRCLQNITAGPAAVREHSASATEKERVVYERGLAFLGTLGNNAPFVGLFGTVLGIIRAFNDLSANTAAGAAAVMEGIAEALVATGVGLLVALPAVAAFNIFTRRVEQEVAAAEGLTHSILAHLETREGASEDGGLEAGAQGQRPHTKGDASDNDGAGDLAAGEASTNEGGGA